MTKLVRFEDVAAAGTGLFGIVAGKIMVDVAKNLHRMYTAEEDLVAVRKHVGAAFLGQGGCPLVWWVNPMCGDDPEKRNKKSHKILTM